MNKFSLFVLAVWVASESLICAQTSPKKELHDLFKVEEHETNYKSYLKKSDNEFEFTAAALFLVYKTFFSSQDMQVCVFYPTCSVYAIESFRKEKFPLSIFKVTDRLMRCHPLASSKYYKIHSSGQLYDPVKN